MHTEIREALSRLNDAVSHVDAMCAKHGAEGTASDQINNVELAVQALWDALEGKLPREMFDGQWEAARNWTYPRVIAGKVYPCARLATGGEWIIDEDGEEALVNRGELFVHG